MIPSMQRILQTLENRSGLTAKELSFYTKCSTSHIYMYLKRLEDMNYIYKDGGKYYGKEE